MREKKIEHFPGQNPYCCQPVAPVEVAPRDVVTTTVYTRTYGPTVMPSNCIIVPFVTVVELMAYIGLL